MYCSFCGCKLDATAQRCPSCGQNARVEFCGGFWGLVGEQKKQEVMSVEKETEIKKIKSTSDVKRTEEHVADIKPEENRRRERARQRKKRQQIKRKIIAGIIGVLFVMCAIQTVRLSSEHKKYIEVQNNYSEIKGEYENLQGELKSVSEEKQELMNEKEESEEKQKKQKKLEPYHKLIDMIKFKSHKRRMK